ncbi:MAG: M1 family aminopeptidase [Nitrospira sp.]|nr:M1 family aminopeptidase [Nitrospira sp.]
MLHKFPPLLVFLLLVFLVPYAYPSSVPVYSHDININFDLINHTIDAVDHLKLYSRGNRVLVVYVNTNIEIMSVRGKDEDNLLFSVNDDREGKKRLVIHLPYSSKDTEMDISIKYTGSFSELPGDIKFSREFLSDKPVAYVGDEIILLDGSSCWYPCTSDSAAFKVTSVTPENYEVVMEGERLFRKKEAGKTVTIWDFPYPSSGIYLVGGRYSITEEKYNDITLYTYLFPEDVSLSATYLDNTRRYIGIYNKLFGKYPFKKFAVVENILSTGFGMPSYTLLGQSVLRLPFIVRTSLGHEIAHNWWGNSVYPDYESGNWSEGLTTYIADHLYEEMDGKGASYRNQLLRDYTNNVKPSGDYPLTKFRNRADPQDRAIGYGKGAYVFHMLKVMLGEEKFYEGLRYVFAGRKFEVTSWNDFRVAYEKVSGKELRPFFSQWVKNSGAPEIKLGEVTMSQNDDGYLIKAAIHQKGRAFNLYLPVLVESEGGNVLTYNQIKDPISVVEVKVRSRPTSIIIDPYYDVFRRLNPEEVPATIGKFMGTNKRLIVLPSKGSKEIIEAYSSIASASGIEGVNVRYDSDVREEDFKIYNIYITGEANIRTSAGTINPELPPDMKIDNDNIHINGKDYSRKDSVLIIAGPNPYNPGSAMLYVSGDNPEYIESAAEKMGHYSKYSYLLFFRGENVEKGTWEGERMRKVF